MCMRFDLILRLNLTFFAILAHLLPKHIDTGCLANATPPSILAETFSDWQYFCQGLKTFM